MDIEKIDLTTPKPITPEEFYLNMIECMKALADYVNKPNVKTTEKPEDTNE